MLDLLTIFSAAGLQQELKAAHGDKSLVIREESEEPSLLETCASSLGSLIDAVDSTLAQTFHMAGHLGDFAQAEFGSRRSSISWPRPLYN